ncbi:hypothetical protein BGX33_000709 [Mortierella sp. NVP41]|nr:hypothetical protein BGX33_000709 [Mortierella sp. NVP41]
MLTVSLAVVFVILAGMGLVVYCLFRRRSAKRRMHLFGSSGSKNISGGSLDSLAAAGEGGANGGKMKILNRRSSMRSLGGGGGNDAVATALAEMQEQQRRISDVDGTRITRRSSVLSLGGLRPLNHHHQHHHQQQQYPGSGVVSPTLGPTRPQSSYWNGNGGAGADAVGEEAGRTSMSGSIVIGSGDYVAGPLESSTEFRTTLYDDLYHPSRQFLYPSGNSSGANSHEQLLGPNHRHHHQQNYPYQYYGGSHSSTNMNRRSSLSPGSYPNPQEMSMVNGANGQRPSPAFRAKTISTGNGHGYQQQMHYPQHYSPQVGPAAGHRPPLVHSSTSPLPSSQKHQMSIAQPSTIASNSSSSTESPPHGPEVVGVGTGARASGDMARSSVPMADYSLDRDPRRTNSISMFQHDSSPYGHGHGDERARSPPLTSSSTGKLLDQRASYDRNSNLVIPPSITTRPRSLMPTNGGGTNNTQSMYGSSPAGSPGVGYPYQPQQQGYPQSGGYGQEYFPERASYESSSRQYHHHPSSGPGKPITPYGYPPHLEHQHHKGLGKTEVIEGAGVGTASSSGNTAAQGGGPKSPQSSSWPRRSNSGGPIVHMAPAPAPPVPSFRSSATAAAAGLTIVTPACGGLDLCKTEAAEVLNSPTDSTAQ